MSSGSRRALKARLRLRARRQESSTREAFETRPLGNRIRPRFAEIGLHDDVPELRGEAARPAAFEKCGPPTQT